MQLSRAASITIPTGLGIGAVPAGHASEALFVVASKTNLDELRSVVGAPFTLAEGLAV